MKQAIRNCLNKKGKNEFWNNDGYGEYKAKHGLHFSDKLAEWASECMVNSNGSSHRWSIEDVKSAFAAMGYTLRGGYTWGDVTYMANQLYSDYSQCLSSDTEAVKMAYAITADQDGYDGMIFVRYTADIMEKGVCVPWSDI